MDSFNIIYKILKTLEKSMKYSEFDVCRISPEVLGTTKEYRDAILSQLLADGYIAGCSARKYVDERYPTILNLEQTIITIKGLEYLSENSMMKKIGNTVKGIAEITATAVNTIKP